MKLLNEFQTQQQIYILMGASPKLAETLALIIISKNSAT